MRRHAAPAADTGLSTDQPFTYAGPVLVSMKPNVDLSLYSAKEQQKYNYAIAGKQGVEPHLFTVGGRAYREMVKNQLSQTVLLTGSAGSGKSEACRQLVRQLIHGCHTDSRDSTEGGKCDTAVMLQQLEAAQEMLRLMGSVAIDDSPDSSRYSVVIKGQFDSEPHLVGIGVKAELMDKSPLSLGHEGLLLLLPACLSLSCVVVQATLFTCFTCWLTMLSQKRELHFTSSCISTKEPPSDIWDRIPCLTKWAVQ